MSFLNPVSEPVSLFKSTDIGAPQINYAARSVGDVKAILKACLVDGYGTIASAGWSIVNEVAHVAEFVSPSSAMSDYRIGIDDTSVSTTNWYYRYQDVKTNVSTANLARLNYSHNVAADANNGWQLMATDQGFIFVEIVRSVALGALNARVTLFSRLKSMFSDTGQNISWLSVGHEAPTARPDQFFSQSESIGYHYRLNSMSSLTFTQINKNLLTFNGLLTSDVSVNIVAPLYLSSGNIIVAEQSGLLIQAQVNSADLGGVYTGLLGTRPALYATVARAYHESSIVKTTSHAIMVIPLDFWEY